MEQKESPDPTPRGEFGNLTPARMAPALMARQLVWREMRIRDQRRRIPAECGQLFVDLDVAKLMIGGVHDVAGITMNPVGKRAAGMAERLYADAKAADLYRAGLH